MTRSAGEGGDAEILARGVARFNEAAYWEAHEAWEELWLRAEPELRRFVQGLIQLAAAWHHTARGNAAGAERLFRSGLEKLGPYRPVHAGIDVADAAARAEEMLARGVDPRSALPRLGLVQEPPAGRPT
jgi:hypothetical protein